MDASPSDQPGEVSSSTECTEENDIKEEDLQDESPVQVLPKENEVEENREVEAGTGDENTFGQLTYYQNDQKLGNAMEALREQREQGRYCDAVLLVGAKQLKAHACLLAANSRYFDVLLKTTESGRPEGEPTSLPFPTDDHRIAKLLLDYMYTGYMGVNLSMIGPLLVASQQLCMDDVVQCCCLHLLNSLGISTWAQIHNLVKTHSLVSLSSDVHKYMARCFPSVCKSKGFLGVECEDLRAVFKYCATIHSADLVQYQFCALLSWIAHRYSERVEHYSDLVSLLDLSCLDSTFVTAALNSDQIVNSGLKEHESSVRILEQLSEQEATQPQPQPQPVTSSEVGGSGGGSSKRKGRKASKPTKRIDDTQIDTESSTLEPDLDFVDDTTTEDSTPGEGYDVMSDVTGGGIYDAGCYEEMEGDAEETRESGEFQWEPCSSRLLADSTTGKTVTQGADSPPPQKRKRSDVIKVAELPRYDESKLKFKQSAAAGTPKEMWVQCEWAGCTNVYSSRRKGDMEDHMNMHMGLRPHECQICGKAFSARKHRQRHEKIHLEVPPIPCTIPGCTFRTTRGDKLREHVTKTHGVLPT